MPPKQKFTKEEIINAALDIVRREGKAGITARDLGNELGCSSSPIFTVFKNMEEVQRETVKAARNLYNNYVEKGLAENLAFKGVGMQYIRFAKEEPRLFALLFMTADEVIKLTNILPSIDDNSDRIIASVQSYGLSRESAYRIYQNMWIFTHGIACLCATGVSHLTMEEVEERNTEVFIALLAAMKKGEDKID